TVSAITVPCMSAERTKIASGRSRLGAISLCSRGSRSRPRALMLLSVRMRYLIGSSAVAALELLHEGDQSLDARGRHGVVKAGAHSAHRAVALQIGEPGGVCLREERLVELRFGQRERHVHPRAAVARHRVAVEPGLVDGAIELLRLGAVALPDARRAALAFEPF